MRGGRVVTLNARWTRIVLRTGSAAITCLNLAACANSEAFDAAQPAQAMQNPAAMMHVADAAEKSGDNAGASAFYRRAAELQPDSVTAQIGAARTLAQQGRVDEAIDSLRSAQAAAVTDPRISVTLGRLQLAQGRPNDALGTFRDGLKQNPGSVPLLIATGVALDTTGQHAQAQTCYKEAMAIEPDSVAASKNLALSIAQAAKSHGAGRAQAGSKEASNDPPQQLH
jgi:tetratricopeptide (TPR) repeat protein